MTRQDALPDPQFVHLLRSHLKYLPAGAVLGPDQPLKPLGLDSMAAVDLLLDLEDTYGVTLADRYLTEATFATAQALWAVVDDLRSGVATEGYAPA